MVSRHTKSILVTCCGTLLVLVGLQVGLADDEGPAMTLEDANETLSYRWDNTGTQATVVITDGISSGSAILTIEDAAGTVVHQDDIANDNDTDTAVGVSGSWRILIDIQNVTGNFTVSVWKKS